MVDKYSFDDVLSNDRETEKSIIVGDRPYEASIDESLEEFSRRRVALNRRVQLRSPAVTEESFARVLP
jgi:hypothetical protein